MHGELHDELVAGGPRRGASRVGPPPGGHGRPGHRHEHGRPRDDRPAGTARRRSRARSLAGVVAAVTASGLAIGTGVAIDRFLLPELRDEKTSAASGSETGSSGAVPPGPQSGTPTGAGTGAPGDRPAGAAPAPPSEPPTPPLKPMRDPSRSTGEPSRSPASKAPSGGSTGSAGSGSAGGGSASTAGQTGPEAAVVSLTNAERAKAGCGPLRVDQRLVTAARRHSADMAAHNYFSHTSRNGDSPWDRMAAAGYHDAGAENIAKGYATAAAVVRGWMNSPGHRANILNCSLRAIGVGRADGPGGPYWTQNFGRK
ncbi:MAG TPA: CAP domain-containing protein [Spirillospora sp.]